MNDRYLFRGKRNDNGKWVIGHLTKQRHSPKYSNHNPPYELQLVIDHEENGVMLTSFIDPATIGQCTGLKDKNGKLIFEGDVIGNLKPHGTFNPTVQFHDGAFWLADFHLSFCAEKAEIIGNVHDNPELINEQQ